MSDEEPIVEDPEPLELSAVKELLHEEMGERSMDYDEMVELIVTEFGHPEHRVDRALDTLCAMNELTESDGSFYRGTRGPVYGKKPPGQSATYARLPPLKRSPLPGERDDE